MSRTTRPYQYLDANGNLLAHDRSDDAVRIVNDADGNPLYVAYGRPGATDALPQWQIRQIVYTDGYPTSTLWPINTGDSLPTNDYNYIWDEGTTFTITAITQANPGVVTVTDSTGLANGDVIYIRSVNGMTQVNNTVFIVANLNAGLDTFELTDINGNDVDTSAYGVYTNGGIVYLYTGLNYTFA